MFAVKTFIASCKGSRLFFVPSGFIAFHFPFEARNRRAMTKTGNVSTIPSHGSSRGLNESSFAAELDLVERSKGCPPVKGSKTIGITGTAGVELVLLTAPVRAEMAAARRALSVDILLQITTSNKIFMTNTPTKPKL